VRFFSPGGRARIYLFSEQQQGQYSSK